MPQIRAYPQATSLEDEDAFVIDRIGAGTMYIESEDFVTPATSAVAWRAGLANHITVPIDNGWQMNGGYVITYDDATIDTDSGVVLSYAYGALANATAQMQFYSPSTVYIAPSAGYYHVEHTVFLQGANEENVIGCGFFHCRSDGTPVYDDDSGSDFQFYTPSINLAPAGGVFDNGLSVSVSALYQLQLGDFLIPYLVRGVTTSTMTIAAYNTNFFGFKIG